MEIFFELCVTPISQRYVQKLERNWNNSGCIKFDNFRKSANFKASQQSALIKKFETMKPFYYTIHIFKELW